MRLGLGLALPRQYQVSGGGGGSPPFAGSDRWGVFMREAQDESSFHSLTDLKFRDGSGTNISTGGTPFSPSGSVSNVFDGNATSFTALSFGNFFGWSSGSLPGSIFFSYASPVNVDRIALYARSSTSNQEITGFRLERSDNGGVDYVVVDTFATPNTWRRGEKRVFESSGNGETSTHWKFVITSGDSIALLSEIEFFDTTGININQTITPTITVSPAFNFGSIPLITNQDGETLIRYTFTAPVTPVDVTISNRTDGFFQQIPKEIDIAYWDGVKWIVTNTYTDLVWVQSETKTFAITV